MHTYCKVNSHLIIIMDYYLYALYWCYFVNRNKKDYWFCSNLHKYLQVTKTAALLFKQDFNWHGNCKYLYLIAKQLIPP